MTEQSLRPEKSLRRIDRENCTWAVQAAVQNSACTIDKKNVGNAAYSRQGVKACQF
jgi:hypothetical protein